MKPEITALAPRAEVQIEGRKPLTRREAIYLAVIQNGKCGCGCGEPLDPLGVGCTDEHVIPLRLGGKNELSNRSLWNTPHSIAKTKPEATASAKVRRLRGELKPKPKKAWPKREFPKGRGFERKKA